MLAKVRTFVGIAAVVAVGGVGAIPTARAVDLFEITPAAVSVGPGGSVEFIVHVNDAPDYSEWIGFTLSLDSVTGRDSDGPGMPVYPYVLLDTVTPGPLIPQASSVAAAAPVNCGGQQVVGCVVGDFGASAGLAGPGGELFRFRLKAGDDVPPGTQIAVTYFAEAYVLVPSDAVTTTAGNLSVAVVPVPEADTVQLLALGLAGLAVVVRRRTRRSRPSVS